MARARRGGDGGGDSPRRPRTIARTSAPVAPADVGGRVVVLRAFQSPSRYIVSTQARYDGSKATGLYADTTEVGIYDAVRRSMQPVTRVEWRRVFHHRTDRGTTTYLAPFVGESALAATADAVVVIPLGTRRAEVYSASGVRTGANDALPTTTRSIDRPTVDAFRDSLLKSMQQSSARFPGAMERVQESFGAAFPVPQSGATVNAARAVGDLVWIEEFPASAGAASRWHLFDPRRRSVVGMITLPRVQRVLGGDDRSVLLLVPDGDGVQSVVRHTLQR